MRRRVLWIGPVLALAACHPRRESKLAFQDFQPAVAVKGGQATVMFPCNVWGFRPQATAGGYYRTAGVATLSLLAPDGLIYVLPDRARRQRIEIAEKERITALTFDFTFTIPSDWPRGEYTLTVHVRDEDSHAEAETTARFTVPKH